ncbi:hypothetical protein [Desulfitobacterium sp. AusDCA]|uniref:hypothetical protein n=1 Tax=Desulfitobacterium sp. AusDCA TaxID=3240383 RepID=UPI003DA739E4
MIEKNDLVEKDERTITVEHASYSMGYKIAMYALLIDTMARSFFLKEASWDLLGIVILCGLVTTVYQLNFKILTKNWVRASILVLIISIIVATVIIFVSNRLSF